LRSLAPHRTQCPPWGTTGAFIVGGLSLSFHRLTRAYVAAPRPNAGGTLRTDPFRSSDEESGLLVRYSFDDDFLPLSRLLTFAAGTQPCLYCLSRQPFLPFSSCPTRGGLVRAELSTVLPASLSQMCKPAPTPYSCVLLAALSRKEGVLLCCQSLRSHRPQLPTFLFAHPRFGI